MNNAKIEVFGNYILLQKLADGGMAEVFLARPATREGDGRLVVIKRILPHVANNTEFLKMFQREIQIIMGFTNAHVVQLHDSGAIDGRPYIAMEYVEGKSLRDILAKLKSKNVRMPVPVALSLAAQAAAGLGYAHNYTSKTSSKPLNIIHRDVSPHNLILSYDGNLKVIDFGIAKGGSGNQELTQTGTVKGKAGYFSPEQLAGESLDGRSDIFSLAVVTWELLTNERLFAKPGDSEVNVMIKVSNCEKHTVPPSQFNPEISPEVDRIILTALQKDPAKRFRDAREFQAALRGALMKSYPAYSYSDTGRLVSVLFAEDQKNDRRQTQELNVRAQKMLGEMIDDRTIPLGTGKVSLRPTATKMSDQDITNEAVMNQRLSKLEAALKQKASGRHYIMLAFYIVSIVALKFGDHYHLGFDFSTQKARAAEMVQSTASVPRAVNLARPTQPLQAPQQARALVPTTRRIASAAPMKSKAKKAILRKKKRAQSTY